MSSIFHSTHLCKVPLELQAFNDVRESLEGMEATWNVFEEFSQGLQQFVEEDWVSFRGRTHLFGDFLDSWAARLKEMPNNSVSLRIRADMEHYQGAMPVLKYLRGDVFGADHWVEFFRIVGFDSTTSIDKLTFGQLVGAAEQIVRNEEAIKALYSRAQG